MRSPQTDEERGHIGAVEALVAPEAVEGAGRRLLDDLGRGAHWSAVTLDAAVTSRLAPIIGDDDPTIRGDRQALREAIEAFDAAKTTRMPAIMEHGLVSLSASDEEPTPPGDHAPWSARYDADDLRGDDPWAPIEGADYDPQITLRGDLRAAGLAMRAAAAPHPLSFADTLPKPPPIPPRAEPPALPLPLVRRADRWLEELPEAARRVLDEARELRPSWPLRERTEGAVLKPKQKIPSLRPPAP